MPTFEVTINGKTYDVDAPNAQVAARAAAQIAGQGSPSQGRARSAAQERTDSRFASGKRAPGLSSLVSGRRPQTNGSDRAVMNSLGMNFDDEMRAATFAVNTGIRNALGNPQGFSMREAYDAQLETERAAQNQYATEHPVKNFLSTLGGSAPLALVPGLGPTRGASILANTAKVGAEGAVIGAGYGAGAGTDLQSRGTNALYGAGVGGVTMTVLHGAGGAMGARNARVKARGPSPQRQLAREGVQLTPGQMAGGLVKNAEDLAQRAPILGPAISSARQRGVDTLSTAQANRALREIGERIPRDVKPGQEAVEYVARKVGSKYDEAADMVPALQVDDTFNQSLAAIRSNASELGTDAQGQFNNILKNRVLDRIASGRPLDGKAIRQMQKEIGDLSAALGSGDSSSQLLSGHLDDVHKALGDLMARSSPEAGEIIKRANAGWQNYVVMRNAAARNVATGVPTPGQLSMAVRASDKSVGKGNVAKGNATMQDLASNAAQVLPDQFGNPGTANAVGLGGLGVGLLTEPTTTVAIGGGLAGGSALYSRPVISAINAVYQAMDSGLPAQVDAALMRLQEMTAAEPALVPVFEQLFGLRNGQPGAQAPAPQ